MGNMIIEKQINAPVERVFAVMIDLERWPETIEEITRIEKLTEGPVRNGTQFKETRVMFGKEHTETMTFEDLVPNRGYTLAALSCGVAYESIHTLAPDAGGTQLRMELRSRPVTLGAKVMSPIMGLMMKSTMRKMISKDFDEVARACEAGA